MHNPNLTSRGLPPGECRVTLAGNYIVRKDRGRNSGGVLAFILERNVKLLS